MNDKKFKIGDKVRIINCCLIEPCELNEVGTLVRMEDTYGDGSHINYIVDMGRPRRLPDDGSTCWWLHKKHIKLAIKPNEQLEFSFMSR